MYLLYCDAIGFVQMTNLVEIVEVVENSTTSTISTFPIKNRICTKPKWVQYNWFFHFFKN